MKPRIHLVCNAHLDPVWLWEWQEGAAEALSTFRTAADLCEEFDNFIFNHNEVVLYEWVRLYEPKLFARIQRLVKQGRWHIMGGWYLQPDCNMPSGESLVRQIASGRRYFQEHFGVRPTTAINFDPFGHSRGLVQIMTQAGYDSYIICRPTPKEMTLEQTEFEWVGFDGSSVTVSRPHLWYNSSLGKAAEKIRQQILEKPNEPCALVLWGVGNHGGGPSRKDLRDLQKLAAAETDREIIDSTPERFFSEFAKTRADGALPRIDRDLNPWGVGCYTSQCRIKQHHRRLENELFSAEKMLSVAATNKLMDYPSAQLDEAQRDLLFSQFHDILPGSSIEPVEAAALRLMDHGLEILSRLKMQAFVALSAGQPAASGQRLPVLVHNPHPFAITATISCEFQLADQNWADGWTLAHVHQGRRSLPTQLEKEASNLTLDWRKRIVFQAELAPSQMNRFDVQLQTVATKPTLPPVSKRSAIRHQTSQLDVVINTLTGLMDRCRINGRDALKARAFTPLVIHDDEDPWGMRVRSYRKVAGRFRLMSPAEATAFAGVREGTIQPVRIIEDGPVRTIVEALMIHERSTIVCRYELPKLDTRIGVEWRVSWQRPDSMLKLSLPTTCNQGSQYLGQTAFGVHDLPINGDECVAQKWVAAVDKEADLAVTLVNDGTYGSDFKNGEIRMSLLRSPAYSAHPIKDRPLVPQDRHTPRIDIGQRVFRFSLNAGPVRSRLNAVDRESLVINEPPMSLCFFPSGEGKAPQAGPSLSDQVVQCSASYRDGSAHYIRLFNPTDRRRKTTLKWKGVTRDTPVTLEPWKIVTLRMRGNQRLAQPCSIADPL